MFEGKPPAAADALPVEEMHEGDRLRELSWGDLVSRLAAARELRASLRAGDDGSFDASSARCVAAHHNGKQSVNLDGSTYFKAAEGMAGEAVHDAASGVARN